VVSVLAGEHAIETYTVSELGEYGDERGFATVGFGYLDLQRTGELLFGGGEDDVAREVTNTMMQEMPPLSRSCQDAVVSALGYAVVGLSMGTPVGLALAGSGLQWGIFAVSFFFMLYFGLPLIITILKVAYCYEIDEYYRGHRPLPGTGLVVALRNLKRILSATLIIAVAFNSGRAALNAGGEVGGSSSTGGITGSIVLNTFLTPGIAIEDASPEAIATFARQTVENHRWEQAFLASQGASNISATLCYAGIAAAIALVVSLGLVPLSAAPYVVVVAFLSPFLGFFAAALVLTTADGPISTALYVYAHQEELPGRLGLDIAQLAKLGER
jgi:hypothetical protein